MENPGKSQRTPVPPYVSYKTLRTFLEGLRPGVPRRIDRSTMRTFSGAVQAGLMATLRYLDLIGEDGVPTDKLEPLVTADGEDRSRLMHAIITSSYKFLFDDGTDLSKATAQEFEERFRRVASGDTVRKCQAFFLAAANDAGIPLSRFITARGTRSNGKPRAKRVKNVDPAAGGAFSGGSPMRDLGEQPDTVRRALTWEELLLAKFPSLDPAWPDDIKAKWFDAFEQLMVRGAAVASEDDEV